MAGVYVGKIFCEGSYSGGSEFFVGWYSVLGVVQASEYIWVDCDFLESEIPCLGLGGLLRLCSIW